ncbi:hypothetical protein I4U23_031042 [Adineta vaga]|nr:hypothetical protein I4U23_031042 [Adineta vaga]
MKFRYKIFTSPENTILFKSDDDSTKKKGIDEDKSTISKTLPLTKSIVDYTLYKYSDIQNSWIICEGHLNYRFDQIKLLNISQFAIFFVVLAKIPIENAKPIKAIYLYRNQKHQPSNFFQLSAYERISDQCSKNIKSKYFLFQLIGKDSNDQEIFGANDVNERDKWMRHINQALNWTKQSLAPNNSTIAHSELRCNKKGNLQTSEHIDADVHSHYEPFQNSNQSTNNNEFHSSDDTSPLDLDRYLSPNHPSMLPRRPVPPIPDETNHLSACPPTENIYLTAEEIPPPNLQVQNSTSTLIEDQIFAWDNIYYLNELDDHTRILNDIAEIGAFLIRPQLKKNKSNDHEYTLSIYAFGGIIKYKILTPMNGNFALTLDPNEASFDTISDLCQYYTNHPLPSSHSRDDSIKKPSVYQMGTLKGLLNKIAGGSKSLHEYETYKYEEIDSKWIIYEDQLQYLYNKTPLGDSLFKSCSVVCARVPIKNVDDTIGLYLFIDEKKTPMTFFPINEKMKISEQCNRKITPIPKCFLFELQLVDRNEPVIFGAKDHHTRKIWINHLKNVFSQSKLIKQDSEPSYLQLQSEGNVMRNSTIESSSVEQNEQENTSILQENIILWNDIFYMNDKDDYRSVLIRTGESGAFLIRPQSKKTSSNDHDYTLCLYHKTLGIRCFGIFESQTRGIEYSLNEPKFYLLESKTSKSSCLYLDLIEYERVERCIEQKKDTGWRFSPLNKTLFTFELMPRHKEEKEVFSCETEDQRNKWVEILTEKIAACRILESYGPDSESKAIDDEDNTIIIQRPGPPIPSRSKPVIDNLNETKKEQLMTNSSGIEPEANLNYIILNPKESTLSVNDIFYAGTFDEFHKYFRCEDKVAPKDDCTLAIRVYENEHSPILSWNIYHNRQMNKYYVDENGPVFGNIVELCSYYMKNDLPGKLTRIDRLIEPYKLYYQ